MVTMNQNKYSSIAEQSLEELRDETSDIKTELKEISIYTR